MKRNNIISATVAKNMWPLPTRIFGLLEGWAALTMVLGVVCREGEGGELWREVHSRNNDLVNARMSSGHKGYSRVEQHPPFTAGY